MEGKRLARSQRGEEPWRCSFRFDGHRNEKQRLGRLARRDKRISVIEEGNGGAVKGILLCPEIEGLCVPVLSARVLAGRTSERTSERANERTSEQPLPLFERQCIDQIFPVRPTFSLVSSENGKRECCGKTLCACSFVDGTVSRN